LTTEDEALENLPGLKILKGIFQKVKTSSFKNIMTERW
jgi:hypothetical protein